MKSGKTRSVVLLAVLWILIGGVWFAGLNWPRWIASGSAADPVRTVEQEAEAEPVIYTLTADPADRTQPPEQPASETEPTLTDGNAISDTPVSDPDPAPVPEADDLPGEDPDTSALVYVLNTNTKKIHLPDCKSVTDMKESNKALCEDPEKALAEGYEWCKRCHG